MRENYEEKQVEYIRAAYLINRIGASNAVLGNMGWTMGLEPTTTGITIRDSTN